MNKDEILIQSEYIVSKMKNDEKEKKRKQKYYYIYKKIVTA